MPGRSSSRSWTRPTRHLARRADAPAYWPVLCRAVATPWGRPRPDAGWALVDGGEVLASARSCIRSTRLLDRRPVRRGRHRRRVHAAGQSRPRRRAGADERLLERSPPRAPISRCSFRKSVRTTTRVSASTAIPIDDLSTARDRGSTRRTARRPRWCAPATIAISTGIVAMDAMRVGTVPVPSQSRSRSGAVRDHEAAAPCRARPPGERALQFFIAEEGASAVAYVVIDVNGQHVDDRQLRRSRSCGRAPWRDPAGAGRARARPSAARRSRHGCQRRFGRRRSRSWTTRRRGT